MKSCFVSQLDLLLLAGQSISWKCVSRGFCFIYGLNQNIDNAVCSPQSLSFWASKMYLIMAIKWTKYMPIAMADKQTDKLIVAKVRGIFSPINGSIKPSDH